MGSETKERDVTDEQESLKSGKKQEKRAEKEQSGRRQKIVTLIISLAVACGFWLYVMEDVNPTVSRNFSDIPVNVMNESLLDSRNLMVTTRQEQKVRVRVHGNRRALMNMDQTDLIATTDASGCTEGENYIDVKVRTLPSVEIEKISPSQIKVDVEPIVTDSRNIRIDYEGEMASGIQPVTLSQELREISVTGAESAVRKVTEVTAEVDVSRLSETSETVRAKLRAVDKKGRKVENVQTEQHSISVTSQLYVRKKVALNVSFAGNAADGYTMTDFQVPETIEIALPAAMAEEIVSITADTVDVSSLKKNETVELTLNLPDNVVLSDQQDVPQAEIKVAKVTQQSIKLDTKDLEIRNLPSGMTLVFDEPEITVSLTGTAQDLSGIGKKNLSASVDAEQVNESSAELPVNIEIEGNHPSVEVAPVKVAVKVHSAG